MRTSRKQDNAKMPKSKTIFSLAVVTPFFNEEHCVKAYFARVIPILNKVTKEWEILCVDDGSTDKTAEHLQKQAELNSRIKIITLSRNFGKEAALTAAFDYAHADAIIPIDADLQDPPELIPDMIKLWKEGYVVVDAVRKSRADSQFKKMFAWVFHRLMNLLTDGKVPSDVGDFRLIDKKAVDAIRMMDEKTRYMKGIVSWVGFKRTQLEYSRPERFAGQSNFNFLKLFKLACDGIFSFSSKPLKIWLYIGVMLSGISFFYACFLIARTILYGVDLPGYASIMVSILFMGGVQLISLGVLGEYIARIFKEVKNRPIYIVDKTHGFEEDE
ncbi:MAG: glycosyltransferase family 2 protein [Candidatus Jidaibacter sp.]|jgi:glycosyltransferase involved in cell wall biosynthesis|nr:glycosyltransferase family 2 protein [Candidatus Jidaibacter sp.]